MKRVTLSFLICAVLSLSIVVVRIIEKPVNVLTWDVFGYYLYLPATFIYDDPGLQNQQWIDDVMGKYQPSPTLYQLVDVGNGNRIIKYSSGLALVYSPFFFAAHWLAPLLGYPADGFSLPYQLFLSLGGILFAILGIFLFRKMLLKFFNDRLTSALLLLVIAGTNYFHLASIDGTLLTHNFLFTLYAALVIVTVSWHETPKMVKALELGLICGLISLIRPSEAVCFLIPVLWIIGTRYGLEKKISLLRKYSYHIIIAAIAALALGFFQFYYWKTMVGEWIYYSYSNNPGEGFRFFPPYIIEFLFSFRKGWFIYTPVMIFSIVGFIVMLKKYKENLPAIFLFFIIDIWIISSWTAWWYGGGSFSSRSLVPAYAVLSLPLGYLLKELKGKLLVRSAMVIGGVLILLNLFQSWQFEKGIIDKERMTGEYYMAIFGKVNVDKEKIDHLLLVDRSTETNEEPQHLERYKGKEIFNTGVVNNIDTTGAIKLDGNNPFSKGLNIPYEELTDKDHAWIRSSMEIWLPQSFSGKLPGLVNSFHYKGEAYKYRSTSYNGQDTLKESWLPVTYWYLTPEVRTEKDNLKIYAWNMSDAPVFIRNLKVEVFELADE